MNIQDLRIIELEAQLKAQSQIIDRFRLEANAREESEAKELKAKRTAHPYTATDTEPQTQWSSGFTCDFCGASDDDGCNC